MPHIDNTSIEAPRLGRLLELTRVTSENGRAAVYVNPDQIAYFKPTTFFYRGNKLPCTAIVFGNDLQTLTVAESAEAVRCLFLGLGADLERNAAAA